MAGNRRKSPRRSYYRCGASTHGHPCEQGSPAAQNLERLVADRVLSRLSVLDEDDPLLHAVAQRWLTTYAPEYDAERTGFDSKVQTLRARLEALEEARWERGEFDDADRCEHGVLKYVSVDLVANALRQPLPPLGSGHFPHHAISPASMSFTHADLVFARRSNRLTSPAGESVRSGHTRRHTCDQVVVARPRSPLRSPPDVCAADPDMDG
ncbi:hypothetical protein [Streptomyces sp. NPDC048340]|uniref:hypothetical protein n=1 Tax=Streptomyces sp. NPDC048340 TaxID=3365537 RepID=UPI003713BCA6